MTIKFWNKTTVCLIKTIFKDQYAFTPGLNNSITFFKKLTLLKLILTTVSADMFLS